MYLNVRNQIVDMRGKILPCQLHYHFKPETIKKELNKKYKKVKKYSSPHNRPWRLIGL
jgi:hypothetical protein